MSTDEILAAARDTVVPPYSSLILYGSYARGDQQQRSDIDILQVVPTHTLPYARGKINFTCYTAEQLVELALGGSLFVKHLISEAVPLLDPGKFADELRSRYVAPKDYEYVRGEVVRALPIVTVPRGVFEDSPHHYSSTASYLLRTYAYARAFEMGATSFSMQSVADLLGDDRICRCLIGLRMDEEYPQFRDVVDLLCDLADTARVDRQESLEAFVVNSYGTCDLGIILGLRILARGHLATYLFIRSRRG